MGVFVELGSVIAAWSLVEVLLVPLVEAVAAVGRFKNARQAEEVRHRPSGASLIARRYCSKPRRRSSRKRSFETVLENQDFEGSGTGGCAAVWMARVLWKARKSEYRLERVKERSGRRRVIW